MLNHHADLPHEPREADPWPATSPARAAIRLPLGLLKATPAALTLMKTAGINPASLLARHHRGDWGELEAADWRINDEHLVHGGRIVSNYPIDDLDAIWIITEADRSVTTLLLPADY